MAHRSRLAGFIFDCKDADVRAASRFWSRALGMAEGPLEDGVYIPLDASKRDMVVEVQSVDHESRVH
jgi:hypothetical protein